MRFSWSLCVFRFLLNPSACLEEHLLQFKFLGILMGVAIRTKKPLDLHLAPMVWKQLCCIPLTLEDLEEVDLLYVQTLNSILHLEDSGITEQNFHEVEWTPQKILTFTLFLSEDNISNWIFTRGPQRSSSGLQDGSQLHQICFKII